VSGIEACDGVDNDCDGSSDEDNPGGGGTCNTGLAGVCGQGVQNCSGGSVQCTATASATTETCDANDNDCDGNTDEGNPGGGGSCNTGLQGACAAGIFTCQAGNIMCLQSSPGGAEVCDAVDNDCDGSVDEGFAVDASNGNVDFPNAWAVTIPQLASYPGTGAGIINGRLLPEGDNDWFTIHAVEDEDDIFGDTAVKGSMTITSPGNGLWYEVCACWSSATTYCGKNSGAAPVCVTSQNGNPASLQVNMSMDLGSTDQGWLDIVVRPDIPALDFSCSNWTLTWQVWE
jgi:hypothetical protein